MVVMFASELFKIEEIPFWVLPVFAVIIVGALAAAARWVLLPPKKG